MQWVPERSVLRDSAGNYHTLEQLKGNELGNQIHKILKKSASGLDLFKSRPTYRILIPLTGFSFRNLEVPSGDMDRMRSMAALQLEKDLPISLDECGWGIFPSLKAEAESPRTWMNVALVRKDIGRLDEIFRPGIEADYSMAPAVIEAARCLSGESGHCRVLHLDTQFCEYVEIVDGLVQLAIQLPIKSADWPGLDANTLHRHFQHATPGKVILLGYGAIPFGGFNEFRNSLKQHFPDWELIYPGGESKLKSPLEVVAENRGLEYLFDVESDAAGRCQVRRRYKMRQIQIWGAASLLFILLCIGVRYLEPWFDRGRTQDQLSILQKEARWMPEVDRELSFLQMLGGNHLMYESLFPILAEASVPQFKPEEISIGRQGEVHFSASVKQVESIAELRQKLLDTKFFKAVVVESQSPNEKKKMISFKVRALLVDPAVYKTRWLEFVRGWEGEAMQSSIAKEKDNSSTQK